MYAFKWPVAECGMAFKEIYTVALAIHHLHKTTQALITQIIKTQKLHLNNKQLPHGS
jgi:hypothetical protein